MKKLILVSLVVLLTGCTGGGKQPAIVEDKTFCWKITMVNPYGYLYHNRCEKSEVVVGEIEGAKIMYKNNLEDRRKEFRLRERKELF